MSISFRLRSLGLCAAALGFASHASAQVTFYQGEGFRGRAFTADAQVDDFTRFGFNDKASSAIVEHGPWEVCEDVQLRGRCRVLRNGRYAALSGMGMNDRISSVRPLPDSPRFVNEVPAPVEAPDYAFRRRARERVFEVPVTSERAVMGPPQQRCWVEREQVREPGRSNPGGAIVGALIGGVLGHEIGGRGAATAGGAVVGAVVGSNVGRGGDILSERDVQRCQSVPGGPPAFWDVTYEFRGQVHRIQMSGPPGATILVNDDGEPRQ